MIEKYIYEILEALKNGKANLAERYNGIWKYSRNDNSIFGVLSAIFILKSLEINFTIEEKTAFNRLRAWVEINLLHKYRNKDNKPSYNFYPTKPSLHFGGGYFMSKFDHFRLPDDIDDTALAHLCFPELSLSPKVLNLLEKHALKNGIFNTWFGKNMPLEFDLCASINTLLFLESVDFTDSDLYKLNRDLVMRSLSELPEKSNILARHYQKPALVYYNYARFFSLSKISTPKEVVSELISLLKIEIGVEINQGFIDMLNVSLLKLGHAEIVKEGNTSKFFQYVGSPLAPYFGANKYSTAGLVTIYWRSEILEKALEIECYVLKNRNLTNHALPA